MGTQVDRAFWVENDGNAKWMCSRVSEAQACRCKVVSAGDCNRNYYSDPLQYFL
jgi:hypothetical protein